MKNSYTGRLLLFSAMVVMLFSCRNTTTDNNASSHDHGHANMPDTAQTKYIEELNRSVITSIPVIKAQTGTRIFSLKIQGTVVPDTRKQTSISSRVSGRIEKLFVKYNYQPVKKGQVIMEVYSPDLSVAQRELIYVARTGDAMMLQRAKQRLKLLGMQPQQIDQVLKTGNVDYSIAVFSNTDGYIMEKNRPAAPPSIPVQNTSGQMNEMNAVGEPTKNTPLLDATANQPFALTQGQYITAGQPLFSIYNSDALVAEFSIDPQSPVKPGDKILLTSMNNPNEMKTATIRLIEPVYRDGQYFSVARVYLDQSNYRVGDLLNATIPVVYKGGSWLPLIAVRSTGNTSYVYRKLGNGFVAEAVKTGSQVNELIQVKSDIIDWYIAANASYLADSESFIKSNTSNSK